MGFPCPDTMELSPIGTGSIRVNGSTAECRCPPGTAQSIVTSKCHNLFAKGPCESGQYFGPRSEAPGKSTMSVYIWWNIICTLNKYSFCSFQAKETLGNMSSTRQLYKGNDLLAARFQMLHNVYKGTLCQGKAPGSQRRGLGRVPVYEGRGASTVPSRGNRHLSWALHKRSMSGTRRFISAKRQVRM